MRNTPSAARLAAGRYPVSNGSTCSCWRAAERAHGRRDYAGAASRTSTIRLLGATTNWYTRQFRAPAAAACGRLREPREASAARWASGPAHRAQWQRGHGTPTHRRVPLGWRRPPGLGIRLPRLNPVPIGAFPANRAPSASPGAKRWGWTAGQPFNRFQPLLSRLLANFFGRHYV
jgi:hypothetical protein